MKLGESREDYLEAMYILKRQKGFEQAGFYQICDNTCHNPQ